MVVNATKKPHIVVLPSPGMGHVTPLLELAKRLVFHHDCHVTFLHITTEASSTQTLLLHSSQNLHPDLTVVDLPPVDISGSISDHTPMLSHLCINVRESLRGLKTTLLELQIKPQALITDLFCTQAFDTCKELSIPTYVLSTVSALFLAFSLFTRELQSDVSDEFLRIPGCKSLKTEDLPPRYSDDGEWFRYLIRRVPMASGIFMNTWEDLESVTIQAIRENEFYKEIPMPPVFPIGPLVKESDVVFEIGKECIAWLDKQPLKSVLFVSLGSAGTLSAEQLTELAWGINYYQPKRLLKFHATFNNYISFTCLSFFFWYIKI